MGLVAQKSTAGVFRETFDLRVCDFDRECRDRVVPELGCVHCKEGGGRELGEELVTRLAPQCRQLDDRVKDSNDLPDPAREALTLVLPIAWSSGGGGVEHSAACRGGSLRKKLLQIRTNSV